MDSRGTSQECPNCQSEVKKDLSIRWHICPECGYEGDRDVASAEVIRDRGLQSVPVGNGAGMGDISQYCSVSVENVMVRVI